MNLEKPKEIDRRLWLSALGVKGEPDPVLTEQLNQCEELLIKTAEPKGIYRLMSLSALSLEGEAIMKHLDGCHRMVVMGATLGAGTDLLIRKSQIRDMADAVILDCGASILIEQVCDLFQKEIIESVEGFLTGRYSPGYGDLPIEAQDQLVRIIDSHRKIGLTVNQSHIMTPRKSITAILGVSDRPVKGYLATCDQCQLRETCQLRKEGKSCAD